MGAGRSMRPREGVIGIFRKKWVKALKLLVRGIYYSILDRSVWGVDIMLYIANAYYSNTYMNLSKFPTTTFVCGLEVRINTRNTTSQCILYLYIDFSYLAEC